MLENIGASLNLSTFLSGHEQLRKAKVKESQAIGSARIYQTSNNTTYIKKFHQIKNEIPLILHGSINQIWTVFPIR